MSRPFADESAFRAVAHPVRRRVLDLLREHRRTVTELFEAFHISQQAFSQHLRILRTSGLVRQRRRGRYRVYSLDPTKLKAIGDWILAYERVWK